MEPFSVCNAAYSSTNRASKFQALFGSIIYPSEFWFCFVFWDVLETWWGGAVHVLVCLLMGSPPPLPELVDSDNFGEMLLLDFFVVLSCFILTPSQNIICFKLNIHSLINLLI